jgi:hypothetical protein
MMDEETREEFLNDLCPRIRPLVANLMDCDCGGAVLDFFRQRSHGWLQATDIAYHLRRPNGLVIAALNRIAETGIVERHRVLNMIFYGLTEDENLKRAIEQFWICRDDWQSRVGVIRDRLQLQA